MIALDSPWGDAKGFDGVIAPFSLIAVTLGAACSIAVLLGTTDDAPPGARMRGARARRLPHRVSLVAKRWIRGELSLSHLWAQALTLVAFVSTIAWLDLISSEVVAMHSTSAASYFGLDSPLPQDSLVSSSRTWGALSSAA